MCAIVVSFVPTQVGAESGTLTVSDILHSQTVTLAGTGLPPPRLSPAPVSVDFGTYTVGQTSTAQTVILTNSGGVPLSDVATNMSGDFAIAPGLNNCPPTLAVGAQCQIGMVFSPTDAGARSGSLTVTATELSKPLLVPLTGTAVPASGVSATPASIDFGSFALGQTSSVQKVTLTNNGGVQLSSLNATVTGDFSISAAGSTCGSTLAVKAQCQIGVVFSPSQGVQRTGTFTLTAAELAKPVARRAFRHGFGLSGNLGDAGLGQFRQLQRWPDQPGSDSDADQQRRCPADQRKCGRNRRLRNSFRDQHVRTDAGNRRTVPG